MEKISISNCPITGLNRKIQYNFFWDTFQKRIIIACTVYFFDQQGNQISTQRYREYKKDLIASDTLVYPNTGEFLTEEDFGRYNSLVAAHKKYGNDIITYQNKLQEYQVKLQIYNSQLENYNLQYAQYEIDLEDYNNNLIEFLPVEPISPVAPTEPIQPVQPDPIPNYISEYDFYVYIFGRQPIILPDVIEDLIHRRDLEGKFNV